jgi:restriction system protein
MDKSSIPTFDHLIDPLFQAIKNLGGSGTIEEIDTKVAELLALSDEQLEILHNPDKGGQTEFAYRLAWARTYLKKYGVLENSSRGVWSLTTEGRKLDHVRPTTVRRFVQQQARKVTDEPPYDGIQEPREAEPEQIWRDELLETLLQLEPAAFERLVQRLLRESGFIQVEVTGRSNDGGIDGKGIMRLGGLLSFHVIFQCKRYRGSVTASQVRDFRGAMVGRADKGLLITTGNFTKEATREATRDGAPAIDLIDGDLLIEKLKDLGLGVRSQKIEVEKVSIDKDWFSNM